RHDGAVGAVPRGEPRGRDQARGRPRRDSRELGTPMHDDDTPIGRILTRREVLALLGGTGAAFLAACAPPASVLASPTARTTTSCASLGGATVDIWHCDALGVYSDASDPSFSTKGRKFLRGYQTTDLGGKVQFTTIYPGWYQGRAVHIHFKIRTTNPSSEFT